MDRLSRSLIDFSKVMDVLERHKVSFVSVTQQFNTSTSMGRLMLNVLLSFAQFEREMISERTRDKIATARRMFFVFYAPADHAFTAAARATVSAKVSHSGSVPSAW